MRLHRCRKHLHRLRNHLRHRQYLRCHQLHHHRSQQIQRNLMGRHPKYRLLHRRHHLHLERCMKGRHQYQLVLMLHLTDHYLHHS